MNTTQLREMRISLCERALELLSPTRCAGCERAGVLICPECTDKLNLIDPTLACSSCAAPFGSVVCTECRGASSACARLLASATFDEPLPRIIRTYKDAGEQRIAPLLAEMLFDTALHAEEVAPRRYGGILSRADAIAFVPATAEAYARRGFDHMEAIARSFAELACLPLLDALAKQGHADQRKLGRAERLGAAADAYTALGTVQGLRLLMLDDVITTGATMSAAAYALCRAGAVWVDGLALARVC